MKPPLPEPLPDDPLPLVQDWLGEAAAAVRNATSMALATVDPEGRPTARMVICRGFDAGEGWFVFYTDRESHKGHALAAHPRAALVFHWDTFERQVRVEGPVTLAPDADSDAYWNTRPPEARIAATTSEQSRPIDSRAAFLSRLDGLTRAFEGREIPRPPRWGGYRVWAERLELWVGQPARAHDRAVWSRELTPVGDGFKGSPWQATRLQP
ncbi:MAG: pyridoxamine 5'-phosphate oxidase [Candidatus Rokubacteria bacterium]|nr:pyridoxamine 5'-phosphate oxidase [Candidatus Rokubacteria bacterium]